MFGPGDIFPGKDIINDLGGDRIVDIENRQRLSTQFAPAARHLCNVDAMTAYRRADLADNTRYIIVDLEEHMPGGIGIKTVFIKADQARLAPTE